MKKSLIILFMVSSVLSCKDDDIVANRTIFKFTLKEPLTVQDYWIVLRDNESGDLIDSRQISHGKTETFESTKKIGSGKMTVTFFRSFQPASSSVLAQVFSDIDVGSEWTWTDQGRNKIDPNTPNDSGEYSLTVNNVPSLWSFTVSDKYGSATSSYGNFENNTVTATAYFHDGVKQLVSIDPAEGKQKYAFVESISYGANIVLDYQTDFKEFDNYLDLNLDPSTQLFVKPYEGAAQYYNNSYDIYNNEFGVSYGVKKSGLALATLDQFPIYRISIYSNYQYEYLGPVPSEIPSISTSGFTTMNETDVDKYELEATSEYNYSRVSYSFAPSQGTSGPSMNVDYYSPRSSSKHFEVLTDEMISKYSIKLDPPKYWGTEITLGSRTYPKLLEYMFADQYDSSQPSEIITFTIRPSSQQ